jgi:hypothetical protein
VAAAILEEVLFCRDHGGLEAVIAHEEQYGPMAGSTDGWEDVAGVVEITEEEFEQIWAPARRALERP